MGLLIAIVVLLFLYMGLSSSDSEVKYGNPPAVLVTVIDRANYSVDHLNRVIEDRKDYARRHGTLSPPTKYIEWV
jgi:mannan polymerase II complex MNN11 subunit